MISSATHPVTQRWPAKNPNILQLYSFPTPNGVKVSTMLEETGLDYEAHRVTLADSDVKSPEFLSLSPNNKIPAILDPNGPDGTPVGLFESGAILIYLAEKTGQFIGNSTSEKARIIQWLMWQMGGLGPMLGQLGFFYKFAGAEIEDPRPRDRYINESKRLLGVLDKQLQGRDWVCDTYSIADMAIGPWLNGIAFYEAEDVLDWHSYKNVVAYVERFKDRPAVQAAINIPPREG